MVCAKPCGKYTFSDVDNIVVLHETKSAMMPRNAPDICMTFCDSTDFFIMIKSYIRFSESDRNRQILLEVFSRTILENQNERSVYLFACSEDFLSGNGVPSLFVTMANILARYWNCCGDKFLAVYACRKVANCWY